MKPVRNTLTIHSHTLRPPFIALAGRGILLLALIILLAACGASPATTLPAQGSPSGAATTDTTTSANTASADNMATQAGGYPIKVYFSKFPDSLNTFTAVFPVDRSSPSTAVATFSIQLLIAGPTLSERSAGYFSEFNSILSGPSSCSAPYPTGGPDFTLTLDKKGPTPSPGTATLQLCRSSNSPGVGADARILAEINATLKQFSTIKNVVVLTQSGNCFGDASGQNRCLN